MTKTQKLIVVAFIFIFIVELFAVFNHLTGLRFFSKPLITVSLATLLISCNALKQNFSKRVLMGLFFSFLGDVFLMLTSGKPLFFMLGLASFLTAHICYISAFVGDAKLNNDPKLKLVLLVSLVFLLIMAPYYNYLLPYLKGMKIPVLIYCIAISAMSVTAFLRVSKVNYTSFILIFVGALFFMVSDATLAFNKFVARLQYGDFAVMATYMLAQFLIVLGTLKRRVSTQQ